MGFAFVYWRQFHLRKCYKFRNDGYRKDFAGAGLSALRTISIAIIRDMYSGD
jgi:hypothetical protein